MSQCHQHGHGDDGHYRAAQAVPDEAERGALIPEETAASLLARLPSEQTAQAWNAADPLP